MFWKFVIAKPQIWEEGRQNIHPWEFSHNSHRPREFFHKQLCISSEVSELKKKNKIKIWSVRFLPQLNLIFTPIEGTNLGFAEISQRCCKQTPLWKNMRKKQILEIRQPRPPATIKKINFPSYNKEISGLFSMIKPWHLTIIRTSQEIWAHRVLQAGVLPAQQFLPTIW